MPAPPLAEFPLESGDELCLHHAGLAADADLDAVRASLAARDDLA